MTAAAGADEPSPGRDRDGDLPDLWLGRYLYGRRAMAPGVISRSLALDLMRPRIAAGESPLSARLLARHRSALRFLGHDGEVAIAPAYFPQLAFAGASSPLAQAAPAMLDSPPATRAAAPLRREARPASSALRFLGRDGEVAIATAHFPELAFDGASSPLAQAAPAMLDSPPAPRAATPLRREARPASVAAPRSAVIQRRAMAPPPRADAGLAPHAVPPLVRATRTFNSMSARAPVPVASIMAPAAALIAICEQPSATTLATAIAREITPTVGRSAVDPLVLRPLSPAAAGVPVATVHARPVRRPMPADGDVAAQPAIPKSPVQTIRPRRIVGPPMRATALADSASAPGASADGLSAATNISVLPAGDLIAPAMPRAAPEPLVTARARSLPPATDMTVLPLPPRAMLLPHERVAALPLPVAPRPPLLPAPVAASEPRPPALAPLSSATVTHTAFVSSRPEPSASAAPASAATRPRETDKPAVPDVGGLAERVYQLLLERLSDERRRRGI
jgi:hypothetical protein